MLNAAAPATPGPGARALYLGSRDRKSVDCTDDALVVRNALRQTRRYPLARVSRVVASAAATDWSGNALMLCLRRGIGITWTDSKGNALGSCYPAKRQTPHYANAVEAMLESPEGRERYDHWLRSRRMEVLTSWGRRCASHITPAQWQCTKHDWVYAQTFIEHLPAALHSHCLAWTAAQLAEFGMPPVLWGADARAIDLDTDLCTLQWAEMNLCAGSLGDHVQAEEPLASVFERWNTTHGGATALHIASLCRMALKATP